MHYHNNNRAQNCTRRSRSCRRPRSCSPANKENSPKPYYNKNDNHIINIICD